MSSGVRSWVFDESRDCELCGFSGDVEVYRDPEVWVVAWDCPQCGVLTNE